MGSSWVKSGLVFTTRSGTPVEPRNISRPWYVIRDRARLGPVRPHDLHHSCAPFLQGRGCVTADGDEDLGA